MLGQTRDISKFRAQCYVLLAALLGFYEHVEHHTLDRIRACPFLRSPFLACNQSPPSQKGDQTLYSIVRRS
eukprot:6200008-Pleurochrysis_carterae.AAC.1